MRTSQELTETVLLIKKANRSDVQQSEVMSRVQLQVLCASQPDVSWKQYKTKIKCSAQLKLNESQSSPRASWTHTQLLTHTHTAEHPHSSSSAKTHQLLLTSQKHSLIGRQRNYGIASGWLTAMLAFSEREPGMHLYDLYSFVYK